MKKRWRIFACLLSLVLAAAEPSAAYAKTQKTENITEEQEGEVLQEEIPGIVESVTLTPGSSYHLDFRNVGRKADISIVSDDPDTVGVNSKGKIIPRKCGSASVHVNWKSGREDFHVIIRVHVKYDSFLKINNYGNPLKKTSANTDRAKLYFHRELRKGSRNRVRLQNLAAGAEVSYLSTKPEIVSVDETGILTAKKPGTSVVRTTVAQNGKKYTFYETIHVKESKDSSRKISTSERNQWFSDSGFIGSSIGVGQKMYFDSQKKGYLGNPTMLVKGCYSFMNDASDSNTYKLTYRGKSYKARTAVRLSGVKKIFINMGMNDLWESPEGVYKRYVSYLDGIRKDSPGIIIFIESTTPVASGNEKKKLSNKNVNKLNAMMKEYCDSQKDMYYIDVNSCLKGKDGCLKRGYSSDGYVHLSMSGYAEWMKALCAYTDWLMIQEKAAEDAVKTAVESREKTDYNAAKKLVGSLEKSTVKSKLSKKLKKAEAKAGTALAKNFGQSQAEDEPQAEALKAVTIKKVTAKSNTALQLSWTKSRGAGYYRIYRSGKKTGKYKLVGGTTKTTWRDRKCKKNTKYYYKVRACLLKSGNDRKSALSRAASGHTRNVPKKVVLAGDSVMEGVAAYKVVRDIHSPGKKKVVARKGLGTLSFQTKEAFRGMTGVDKVIAEKPDRLYLMLGMNEISYRSTSDMLNNYQEILDQIREESPKTEIVLLAVSPVTKGTIAKTRGFAKIPGWNKKVKRLAKKNGCRYLDYTKALKGKGGYLKYNGGDGIHWNASGYRAFVKQIEKYEKKLNR